MYEYGHHYLIDCERCVLSVLKIQHFLGLASHVTHMNISHDCKYCQYSIVLCLLTGLRYKFNDSY